MHDLKQRICSMYLVPFIKFKYNSAMFCIHLLKYLSCTLLSPKPLDCNLFIPEAICGLLFKGEIIPGRRWNEAGVLTATK